MSFTPLEYAQHLATVLYAKHGGKENAPHWKVGDDLLTVLLQIDNMTVGLVRPGPCAAGTDAVENSALEHPNTVASDAPAGARVQESPGVISLSEARNKSAPSHVLCVGWKSIRRLAREGMIWDAEHEAGIVAADDLFGFDFTTPALVAKVPGGPRD